MTSKTIILLKSFNLDIHDNEVITRFLYQPLTPTPKINPTISPLSFYFQVRGSAKRINNNKNTPAHFLPEVISNPSSKPTSKSPDFRINNQKSITRCRLKRATNRELPRFACSQYITYSARQLTHSHTNMLREESQLLSNLSLILC
uniref:(northern house mosquito) hypothetical protein n=1 Tax=Culex pipiens TaxID=7175 RepID=A0A8D8C1E2_CULPI